MVRSFHSRNPHSFPCKVLAALKSGSSGPITHSASRAMSSSPDVSRLCRLINDSLLPYTETESVVLTKGREKDLLILLSQISRKIKSWADEQLHSDSETEIMVNSASNGKCCHALDPLSGEGHDCLANVVYIPVIFLTVENQYVRHTAGNILVVISDFLVKTGSNVKNFFQLLWASLEAAIFKIHSSTLSGSNIFGEERLGHCYTHTTACGTVSFISLLLPKLLNANWVTATDLVQVLRKILKSLKTDHGELAEENLTSFHHSLQNVSWDLLHENHADQFARTWMIYSEDSLFHRSMCSLERKDFFLGTLIQLFCSLVDQNGLEEVSDITSYELPVFTKIIDLVPSLLAWCLSRHVDYKCISRYLRHKLLMLMIRLSFHIRHQCSTIVLWLQLLRQYFEDLLYKPISERHDGLDNCLEGSPFLSCIADGEKVQSLCTRHLQRQTILLLFKCSFSLISFSEETGRHCPCKGREHCSTKGLAELFEWLQRHVPPEKFVDYNTDLKICSSFASSFLRLYMDEDNFLFEMLLQLLSISFPSKPIQYKQNEKIIEKMKGDAFLYISSIFNPIHIFHLFLAELHYDHLVLLDYLISKDSGVHCAQYLLRCLRIVCKSWYIFVEFSLCGSETSQTSCKKRKVYTRRQDSHGKAELSLSSIKGIGNSNGREKRKRRRNEFGNMHKAFKQRAFENAKGCLLSLKESVENLHQKKLFPYNPSALLRSINRFQELCQLQEKEYLQKTDVEVT